MKYRFTEEIKAKWLEALKSGKYTQGFVNLEGEDYETNKIVHCCIGVLGCEVEGLNNFSKDDSSPYKFLKETIGRTLMENLYFTNDNPDYRSTGLRDYSNVIPLIEKLPTNG